MAKTLFLLLMHPLGLFGIFFAYMACGRIKTENINSQQPLPNSSIMTMRNQIKNAVAEFFISQVPSILEDSTKDDSSSSEGEEEDDDDDEKSEGEDTEEGGSHTEEAQLDRKVPNGNRKCCNR